MNNRILTGGGIAIASALALGCTSGLDPVDLEAGENPAFEAFVALPEWDGLLQLHTDISRSDRPEVPADRRYYVRLSATNVGQSILRGTTGTESWWFRAFTSDERDGEPVWTDHLGDPRRSLIPFVLRPGEVVDFPAGGHLPAPDTVPARTYFFTFSLRVWTDSSSMRTPFVPAGQVTIRP